ncbi:MAG: peptidylprolyl isomerase [Thermoanaerobaculia bacterium]
MTKAEAEALLRPLGDDTSEDEAFAGRAATLLDRFAVNALLAAEARRRGLDERPEKRRELEWVREEQLSKETLRWKVDPMMTEPDEEAIRGYYESHLDNYREPERYGLRVLQRPGSPEAIADGYRELANVRAAVRDGEPMIDTDGRVVARVWYSRSQVAGWGLTVLRSVDRLRPGEVTEPIQQGDALWLIQLVEREPGQLRDLSAVRGKVARAIEREERWRLDYQLLQRTLEAAALERPSEVGRTQQRGKD